MQITFSSRDPDAWMIDHKLAELPQQTEKALGDPAYWNSNHPHHHRAVAEVNAGIDAFSGGTATQGPRSVDGGQPFGVFSFSSADGALVDHAQRLEQMAPTVFNRDTGLPDEHTTADHRERK